MNQATTASRDSGRICIRPARGDDAPQLARLAGELGYPTGAGEMRLRLEKITPRADHAVFVAERRAAASEHPGSSSGSSNGSLLGWIHVAREIMLESGENAEILGLVVDGRARRDGVGRRLVAVAEEWGRARGLTQIVVRSAVTRDEAHRFYPALGYLLAKTQRKYVKKLNAPSAA